MKWPCLDDALHSSKLAKTSIDDGASGQPTDENTGLLAWTAGLAA